MHVHESDGPIAPKTQETSTSPTIQRLPALDGLRCFAVLAVMVYHSHLGRLMPGGFFGVDVFFVLSGFLITKLLIAEFDRRGRISIARFYERRALRLFPALVVLLVFASACAVLLPDQPWSTKTLSGIPWVILYAANIKLGFGGDPDGLGLLLHTWSLSVEEQFYLVIPVLFMIGIRRIRSRSTLAAMCFGTAALEIAYRIVLMSLGANGYRVANGLDTHSDGLLIGCGLAFYLASRPNPLPIRALRLVSWVAVLTLLAMVITWSSGSASASSVGYPLAAVATALLVTALVDGTPRLLILVLTSRPAVWIGERSYGLYLWHVPIFLLLTVVSDSMVTVIPEFAVSFAAAALSYRLVEKPFLRLKDARRANSRTPVGSTS